MPRFFIKLKAPYPVDDVEGQSYATLDCARADAVRFLGDLLNDRAREICPGDAWRVTVSDENHIPVCVLSFAAS